MFKRKKTEKYVSKGVQTNDIVETKIRVQYPRSRAAPNSLQLILNLEQEFAARLPPGLSKSSGARNVIALRDKVAEGHFCSIWRARLDEDHDQRVRLIARISRTDSGAEAWVCRMREEATRYAVNLNGLQGTTIPIFYGLWKGEISGRPVVCMLVEDCGAPPSSLTKLPMETK